MLIKNNQFYINTYIFDGSLICEHIMNITVTHKLKIKILNKINEIDGKISFYEFSKFLSNNICIYSFVFKNLLI